MLDQLVSAIIGPEFADGPRVNPAPQGTWPFPPFPNPLDNRTSVPKFNPDNFEDAPI